MEGWTATSAVEPNRDCDQGEPWLPPGFRFHPTDEELVTFYLASKIQNANFSDRAITDADLNKNEPWELPGKAKMGEKEWYFYSSRDRKYPTGMRTNRATQTGYWKATGKDRDVISSRTGKLVGMKKTLVFYKGRAPKGLKTNWVMHEYRAEDIIPPTPRTKLRVGVDAKDEWVVCRIFHKSAGGKKMALADLQRCNALTGGGASHVDARIARIAATLPALMELPLNTTATFSAALPSPHLPVLAQPSNVHLANLLKSLPAPAASTSMNAFAATLDYAGLDNSVVKALYQHYSSTVNAMSTLHPAIKPEPSRAVDVSSYTSAGFPNYSPAQFNTHLPPLLQDHGQLINGNTRNQLPSPRHMLQEQHNQTARMQPMMSVNANHFTPEAISDSCATEYVLHPNVIHPTQFPRFASDLENLWLYAESEPIINRFRLPNH